jgi:signal transduction histidine kinase
MIVLALAAAAGALVLGVAGAFALQWLPSLRAQLLGVAVLAGVPPLAAVLVSGVVMFESAHDMTVLAVVTAAALAGITGAVLLARRIARAVGQVRSASAAFAAGDLSVRAPVAGPADVARLAEDFNAMAANLEALFDARRQLVAFASHDLRTPLTSVRAMLEATDDGVVPPTHYLKAMREQVESLGRLVDDLFELASIDAGALRLEIREAQLGRLVESCLRGLEADARAAGVSLDARLPGDPPRVRCAPEAVGRVLANLVANALRHTPYDGTVAVVVEPAVAEVRVSVEDTGAGLSPEALSRAFERFWRADRERPDGRARAGLGLAIARGLLEAQGGRIWAENRPEGGARFSFTLPAA